MSKILAIDTSTFVMGVAVTDGEQILGEVITNLKKNHSLRLMPAIDHLMKEVEVSPKELEKIVVAVGPGSYTGVRIGVTTAKTLAWSLGIPLVGVSSLAVMAQAGRYFDGDVSPIIDARRGRVYTGLYDGVSQALGGETGDQVILLEDWLERLCKRERRVLFVGQDVNMHREAIEKALGERAEFALFTTHLPRPSELAQLGELLPALSPHEVVPNYHQLAEAEAKWQQAQKDQGKQND